MEKTPEAIFAEEASIDGASTAKEVNEVSAEDIAASEDEASEIDAFSDADAREAKIELTNDTVDTLVDQSQEFSDEGIEEGKDRG